MTIEPRTTKARTHAERKPSARAHDDDAHDARRDRQRRIGAAQMAAPSTRTWRRAGRFASST
jgi:hypothetical protein